ncbi:lactonase family protein, partial [Arthrobacter sp. NamB2]|uniref:lactonase family protein n=1 Tax=Arthrobacter sp. NamB2 TaxID=2576035 RepID=UPI0010C9E6AF
MKYTSMRAARKSLSLLATGALAAGMLTIGSLSPSVSTPAQAAPALDCGSIYSIQGMGDRNLWQVDTGTGAQTSVGTATIPNSTQSLNGLGISRDGSAAFGVLPNTNDNGRTIYRIDRATGETTPLGAGVNGTPVTHGAINPANGLYYYGGFNTRTNVLEVYGFDVTTGTSLNLVASGTIPQAGRNGDWVFDQQGNLYVVGGGNSESILSVVDQPIPATGGAPIAVTGTQLANIVTPDPVNGIAISSDGLLYLGSGSALRAVDPVTGDVVRTVPLTQAGSVDFASCATPSTVTLQKNFPLGRAVEGEQVTLSLAGGGLPAGLEDTTEGNDPGVQNQPSEVVGPVFGRTGATYTITETGAGARPSSPTAAGYTSTWSCIDQNTNTVIASGTGTTGSFTMPNGG